LELIIGDDAAQVWHAFVDPSVRHSEYERLRHFFAVTLPQQPEVAALLALNCVLPMTVSAVSLKSFWPCGLGNVDANFPSAVLRG
jgi:hypothetical protein